MVLKITLFKWSSLLLLSLAVLSAQAHSEEMSLLKVKNSFVKFDSDARFDRSKSLAGLWSEELVKKNKIAAAKQILELKQKNDGALKEVINFRLAKIAVQEHRVLDFEKHMNQAANLLNNINVAKELYDMVPQAQKKWLVDKLIKSKLFEPRTPSTCPFFELSKRKTRAEFLFTLVKDHALPPKIQQKILYELYVLVPEAVDTAAIKKLAGFDKFFAALKATDLVSRMESLLTFGKNSDVQATFIDKAPLDKKITKQELCELQYIDAKADYKLRRNDIALNKFALIVTPCLVETSRKARYMELLIAIRLGDEKSLPKFDAFVASFPDHSFADDVMMFKAGFLFSKDRFLEGMETLDQLIEKYPNGDMIHRAHFLRAFNWARQNKTEMAITAFSRLKDMSDPESLDFASAKYWAARLSIFGNLNHVDNANGRNAEQAKKQFRELMVDKTPTIYSWLSMTLLKGLGEKIDHKKIAAKEQAEIKFDTTKDKQLFAIEPLIRAGFRTEALMMLDDVDVDTKNIDRAISMAIYYDVLNQPELGHQKLVRCNGSLARALSKTVPDIYKRLSFARPYLSIVESVGQRVNIPKALIFAIMRQESGFTTHANSWAGAKGVMQLILSSAVDEARQLSMSNFKESDLYVPDINILLGSSMISRYLRQFGNLAVSLAAYNAGPGNAKAWKNRSKGAPIDTFIEDISFKETRSYVKSVLGSTFVYAMTEDTAPMPNIDLVIR